MKTPFRIGICSTYAPRACGLATFAADLEQAILGTSEGAEVIIIAMVDPAQQDLPGAAVQIVIEADAPSAYLAGAARANEQCDVVIVEHEFGIFGGEDGEYLLRFMAALTVPVILTLHTVVPSFSLHQRSVLADACRLADAVTVFSGVAEDLLIGQRLVERGKLHLIPHGAPNELYESCRVEARAAFDVADRFVVSTFGLLSPGKGLELAIESMRTVVESVPNAQLIIAGRSHPGETHRHGERYRSQLHELVADFGLGSTVRFIDKFLAVTDIANLLAATDLFVTPYVNPDQIVSGALTFALAAGCPVVSTPYLYASDQLCSGAGVVVNSRNPLAFARAITRFALDSEALAAARECALHRGADVKWSVIGQTTVALARSLTDARVIAAGRLAVIEIDRARSRQQSGRHGTHPGELDWSIGSGAVLSLEAAFPTTHLRCLVDDVGIVQHATGVVPMLSSGYCVDDVARLVPVAFRRRADADWSRIAARGVSFLTLAWEMANTESTGSTQSQLFNFMSFDRTWVGIPSRGDHVGRAAMGLASVAADRNFAVVADPVLRRLFQEPSDGDSLHQLAYTLLGQVEAPWLTQDKDIRRRLNALTDAVERCSQGGWTWLEPSLRYDNGLFPETFLAVGEYLGDERVVETGLRLLKWLDSMCDGGDHYRFPGHLGLAQLMGADESGDEQPLEAAALVRAHLRAWKLTGSNWHRVRAMVANQWYLGRNRRGVALVDERGGCFDGLTDEGVNRNQGAESTLAAITSMSAISDSLALPITLHGVTMLGPELRAAPSLVRLDDAPSSGAQQHRPHRV